MTARPNLRLLSNAEVSGEAAHTSKGGFTVALSLATRPLPAAAIEHKRARSHTNLIPHWFERVDKCPLLPTHLSPFSSRVWRVRHGSSTSKFHSPLRVSLISGALALGFRRASKADVCGPCFARPL